MADENKFKNKLPSHKTKKDVIVFVFVSLFSISALIFYVYTENAPIITSKFPTINITSEGNEINRDDYVDCMFEVDSDNSEYIISPIESKIKIRGDFNAGRPKKGYRIELSQQKPLVGLRKDDDWILFAMYFDIPRVRIKMAFDLWNSLEQENQPTMLPELKYINLYIDGEYQGLYLLAEKNDRKLFGLADAQNNIDSSLIFQAKGYTSFNKYDSKEWEQDWPNEDEEIYIMDEIMIDLISFISSTTNEEFFEPDTGIYTKFDKTNLVDFFIFSFFILHRDIWDNNFFIIRDTHPNKYYLVPWDFDYTLGQKLSKKYRYDENPELDIHEKNKLFSRLISNKDFMEASKKRWNELRVDLWTDESILDMLDDNYEEVKDILKYEANLVYSNEFKDDIDIVVDKAVNYLFEWIPKRLEYCDSYFINC